MENELSTLEKAVVSHIAFDSANDHLSIASHLPYLTVRSREKTGVGMYINFDDATPDSVSLDRPSNDVVISSNQIIQLDTLKDGLGFALYLRDGKLKFLELFTYGSEIWDGSYGSIQFVSI
jgi:hypothetical protein